MTKFDLKFLAVFFPDPYSAERTDEFMMLCVEIFGRLYENLLWRSYGDFRKKMKYEVSTIGSHYWLDQRVRSHEDLGILESSSELSNSSPDLDLVLFFF